MSFNDIFLIVPNPFLSGLIWFVIIVAVMYFARTPAHLAITSFCRVFHNAMRLSARAVMRAEDRLTNRNREVLLAQGREAAERIIEREFDRVDSTVRRDLAEYPALHRQLSEEITQIDDDYKDSTEVPPEPPGWVKAVDAVAKIPGKDPMVASILEDIHSSMVKANTQAIEEYRKSSHKRHEHLKNMMPHWRKVRSILGQVDKSVTSLLTRSQTIDRHMDEYEQIVKQSDRSVRMLSSSSLTHFFISAFVLAIAVGGGIINFELIAYPMAQMVAVKREIGGFETASVAALVIILVEISMGIFLMELLRVTKLFPVIGSLNDKLRVKMAWTAFGFLFGLACVEAGLAFMREIMIELVSASKTGESFDAPTWILTAAQMGLGFILPFALMFVAIPLETFVHSLRTVLGIIGIGILRGLAWLLRFIGNIMRFLGKMLVNAYDFVIFAPLWVERKLKNKEASGAEALDSASSTF
jgi:hypothetical protein